MWDGLVLSSYSAKLSQVSAVSSRAFRQAASSIALPSERHSSASLRYSSARFGEFRYGILSAPPFLPAFRRRVSASSTLFPPKSGKLLQKHLVRGFVLCKRPFRCGRAVSFPTQCLYRDTLARQRSRTAFHGRLKNLYPGRKLLAHVGSNAKTAQKVA